MSDELEVLGTGKYLRLVRKDTWEYVHRVNSSGVVGLVAVTPAGELLLVEQPRAALGTTVIEPPAGLAGDITGQEEEDLSVAADRELIEETGYKAGSLHRLFTGPSSPGMSSETITFYAARDLQKVGDGGGDDTEDITVHAIPLADCDAWLRERIANGAMVDPKTWMALYFAQSMG